MSDGRPPILDYATPPNGDEELVPLCEFSSSLEANLAVALLDGEGIASILAGENAAVTIGLTSNLSRITLLVPRGDRMRAVELLRDQLTHGNWIGQGSKQDSLVEPTPREPAPLALTLLLALVLLVIVVAIQMM